jgi:Spx/MgsR family transcriptional regulator
MITLYGIPNCDKVRAARKWLEARNVEHQFHDLREDGLGLQLLLAWVKELGWETLLNQQGTTWRKLPEALVQDLDQGKAFQLMLDEPTLVKRPVLDMGDGRFNVGFTEAEYEELFP